MGYFVYSCGTSSLHRDFSSLNLLRVVRLVYFVNLKLYRDVSQQLQLLKELAAAAATWMVAAGREIYRFLFGKPNHIFLLYSRLSY